MVSLHGHSSYSVQDALPRIKDIALKQKEQGDRFFAITDHGSVSCFPEAFKIADQTGMTFIPGCEFYLKPEGKYDLKENLQRKQEINKILKTKISDEERETLEKELDDLQSISPKKYYHITVLAKNSKGIKNLFKIFNHGDYYYKNRILEDFLIENKEGLIVLSGCLAGKAFHMIENKDDEATKNWLRKMKEAFGNDFYAEIQYHNIGKLEKEGWTEESIYNHFIRLAKEVGCQLIATNDSHYVNESDREKHDIYKNMCYFQNGKKEEKDNTFNGTGYHITTEEELRERFAEVYSQEVIDESINNIEKILNSIDVNDCRIEIAKPLKNETEKVMEMAKLGWKRKRKGTPLEKTSWDRLQYEMEVVDQKGFSGYFLNVNKILERAREKGIMYGPGRGSGAGSELCYLLDITKVDPLKYGLIFERFINPNRGGFPDIDIDIQSIINIEEDEDGKM